MKFGWIAGLSILAPLLCAAQQPSKDDTVAHFGTTVFLSTGLRGDIYFIAHDSMRLPNFKKSKPVGTIYTSELNVPRRNFDVGFPGVTDRFEWFAIDYTGKFWVENPGKYTWALLSDDGSRLYINDREVINNDGQHPPRAKAGTARLKRGEHRIRVAYFQGPRDLVALILAVIPPGEKDFLVFNTEDYLSPEARAEMKEQKPDEQETPEEIRRKRTPGERLELEREIPIN